MPIKFKKTWKVVIIVILFYLVFLGIKLYQNNYNLGNFILLGDKYATKDLISNQVKILPNSPGYDGQFYYRLALDPFTKKNTDFGITLDQPALRQQRILYPLLSWLFSFGNSLLVPWSMFMINIVALLGLIYLAIKLTRENNQPEWLAILIPLYPTFLISITRNLTEILSSFLLIGGYLLFIKNKNYFAVFLFTLAVLARETTLVFSMILVLYSLFLFIKNKNKADLKKALLFSVPFVFFMIWQIILGGIWGQGPLFVDYSINIVFPFRGWADLLYFKTPDTKIRIFEILYLLEVIFLGSLSFKKNYNWPLKITWLSYVLMFTLYSKSIWAEDFSFFRACTELFIFSFILIASNDNQRIKKLLFFSTLAMTGLIMLKIFIIGNWPNILLFFSLVNKN